MRDINDARLLTDPTLVVGDHIRLEHKKRHFGKVVFVDIDVVESRDGHYRGEVRGFTANNRVLVVPDYDGLQDGDIVEFGERQVYSA